MGWLLGIVFGSLFLVAGGALLYTYVIYPLILMAKSVPPRDFTRSFSDDELPTVSFIIVARNERETIQEKLENTLQLDYPKEKLEIIVASDGSDDGMDDIVRQYESKGVRLVRPPKRLGKTLTANYAVRQATGEVLVFSDATSIYEPSAIRHLISSLHRPFVGVVSGKVVYRYPESSMAQGFKVYQKFVVDQRVRESELASLTSVSGAIHAIRKEDYHPIEPHQAADLILPFEAACEGKRAVYEPRAVCVETSRSSPGKEYNSRIRAALLASAFMEHLWKNIRRVQLPDYLFVLISGKILRWLSPYLFLLMTLATLFLSLGSSFFGVLLVLEILAILGVIGTALASLKGLSLPLPGPLVFGCITLTAFTVGIYKYFVEGERMHYWEPERG